MAGKAEDGGNKRLVKISELPVYGNPEVKIKLLPEEIGKYRECISVVRKAVQNALGPFQATIDKTKHIIETGEAHTKSSLNQISEEGLLTKLTVIGLSGLAGNILAMKGGILRKTAFTTFGLLAATSICYPNEAVALTTEQYENLKSKILEFKNSSESDDKSS